MKNATSYCLWLAVPAIAGVCAGAEFSDLPALAVRAQTIDDKIQIGYGLAIADVDGDGRDDILLADKSEVVWYRNPGWTKHRMTGQLTPRDHVCIAARDIDGDGKAEVAVGAEWNPGDTQNSGAVFYLVPPEDRTKEWEAIKLAHEPTVHRMHWVRDGGGRFFLAVLPLHGRGNRDGDGAGVRFLGYRRPADARASWETFVVDDALHITHNFDPIQWGEPGPGEELLTASKEGLVVFSMAGTKWSSEQLTMNGAGEVRLGKLPGGGVYLASVEPFHGNELVVNTRGEGGGGGTGAWGRNRVVLDDKLVQGHALATGDLLGTGWDQIVVGWRGPIPMREGVKVGIKLFVPTDREGRGWKQHALVDDNQMACEDLKLADLNRDGKVDIIACGRATKNVVIYWNETGR